MRRGGIGLIDVEVKQVYIVKRGEVNDVKSLIRAGYKGVKAVPTEVYIDVHGASVILDSFVFPWIQEGKNEKKVQN